jgi:hypothetical protein
MKFFLTILLIISFKTYSQQTWLEWGEMTHPVYAGEAIATDSLIYIIGGFSVRDNKPVNLIQEYNPGNGEWKIVDTLVLPRSGFVAGKFSDSVLIAGGASDSNSSASIEVWNRSNSPYIYDSESNSVRNSAAGIINNNILYVFGGIDFPDTLSTYMYEYDILSDSIIFSSNFIFNLLSMPFYQGASLLGDDIYLFGGGLIGSLKTIYKYNTVTREFSQSPLELIQSRAGNRAVTVVTDKVVTFIIGGFNESDAALNSVEIFERTETGDTIYPGPELNYARREFMAVDFKGSVFIFGGLDEMDVPVSNIEMLEYGASVNAVSDVIVSGYKLNNNFPNPFNPSTQISYEIPVKSFVLLKVYDFLGSEVAVLVNEIQNSGTYNYTFSPTGLSSGVYFFKLSASVVSAGSSYTFTGVNKMIYLK